MKKIKNFNKSKEIDYEMLYDHPFMEIMGDS